MGPMNTALITPQPAQPQDGQRIHPLWLRLTHWLNALAVVILVTSGWRIYNAAPFFDFSFPGSITLGGWLGGALQWHFAAMWLLVFNGLLYLLLNIASGRWLRKFFPITVQGVRQDLVSGQVLWDAQGRQQLQQRRSGAPLWRLQWEQQRSALSRDSAGSRAAVKGFVWWRNKTILANT